MFPKSKLICDLVRDSKPICDSISKYYVANQFKVEIDILGSKLSNDRIRTSYSHIANEFEIELFISR